MIAIALVVGCVGGQVAERMIVPPAPAGAAAQRWGVQLRAERDQGVTDVVQTEQPGSFFDARSVQYCFQRLL